MPLGFGRSILGTQVAAAAADQVYEVALGIGTRIDLYQYDTSDDSLTFDETLNPNVGNVDGLRISPNGDLLVCSGNSGDNVAVYEKSGSTWTKQSKPAGAPSSGGTEGVAFSNDGNYLALTSFTERAAYSISGTTLTQLTINEDSAGQDIDRSQSCTVSADGTWWIYADRFESDLGGQTQGSLTIFKRTGTQLDYHSSFGSNDFFRTQRVAINADADEILCSSESSPFINFVRRSGDTWTAQTLTSVVDDPPEEGRRDCFYSPDGQYAVSLIQDWSAPEYGVIIYSDDGDGTYTRLADSATGGPLNTVFDSTWISGLGQFSTDGTRLFIGAQTNNSATTPIFRVWSVDSGTDIFTTKASLFQDSAGEDVRSMAVYPGFQS